MYVGKEAPTQKETDLTLSSKHVIIGLGKLVYLLIFYLIFNFIIL